MSENINSDFLRGNINTIILRALYDKDRYGYEIAKEIEEKSNGEFILKQPTLYSSLRRLENQGFIQSYWGEESNGGRRKYFTLTAQGREVFVKNQGKFERSHAVLNKLIAEDEPQKEEETVSGAVTFDGENTYKEKDISLNSETALEEEKTVDATPDYEIDFKYDENKPEGQEISVSEVVPAPANAKQKTDEAISESNKAKTILAENTAPDIEESKAKAADIAPASEYLKSLLQNENNESYSASVENAKPEPSSQPYSGFNDADYRQDADIHTDENVNGIDEIINNIDFYGKNQSGQTNQTYSDIFRTPPPPVQAKEEKTEEKPAFASEPLKTGQNIETSYADAPPAAKIDTEYQNILSGIVEDFSQEPVKIKRETAATKDDILIESRLSVKEQIQVRNFGKLADSVKVLGEDVKIRTPDAVAQKEYTRQYYYQSNFMMLFHYGILFLAMLFESFFTFLIVKSTGAYSTYDTAIYTLSVIFAFMFPVIAAIMYINDPYKRKRINYNFKSSLLFRLVIMLQCIIIIYALNVYMGMPFFGDPQHALSLWVPVILTTNIPVSTVIFNFLYRSKKFSVTE